ncbi:hypothetical protein [Aestuariivirga sp.]|uniref:hypothetical protein n=1 Tax=Aestuariivirga sp. TaxID=2650926 RepID=UPI0039E30FB1
MTFLKRIAGVLLVLFAAAITLFFIPMAWLQSPGTFSVMDTGLPMFAKFAVIPFIAGVYLLRSAKRGSAA